MTRKNLFPDIPFSREGHYILKGRRPAVPETWREWAQFMEDRAKRRIAEDKFVNVDPWLTRDLKEARKPTTLGEAWRKARIEAASEILVSTVFIGLDHGWRDGPPIVFETMVFNGPCDGEQHRYASWDDAEAGHKATVGRVLAALTEKVK